METTELKKINSSTDSAQRSGYLKWDEYFMALCFVSAQRSKDPNTQVIAKYQNENIRISILCFVNSHSFV